MSASNPNAEGSDHARRGPGRGAHRSRRVSPLQLRNLGFIADIGQVISVDAHAADGIELENTESLIMEDVKHSIAILQAIRATGVTIAIDDFGTGFSSLSYLAKLPVEIFEARFPGPAAGGRLGDERSS